MAKRKKKPKRFSGQLLIWDVPPDLKRAFKRACVSRDTTMRESVLGFMREKVDDDRHEGTPPAASDRVP